MTLHDAPTIDLRAAGLMPFSTTMLHDGDPSLMHAIVHDGTELKQLLLGLRHELPERLDHARIGAAGPWQVYDALQDTELNAVLFQLYADNTTFGDLRFTAGVTGSAPTGRPFAGHQRNTSVMYGQQYVHKVFRRVTPGAHPDLTLHRALESVGNPHIAPVLGTLEGEIAGRRTVFAMVQEFQRLAAVGWPMATASVRDFLATRASGPQAAGGDFAAEAQRLGCAVARTHLDLADALGVEHAGADLLVRAMHARLDQALDEVPGLRPHTSGLRARYDVVLDEVRQVPLQHVHADLHLGQVLRTPRNWVLIDFEGTPGTPGGPMPALHDVACLLRSLHYAAAQMLVGLPDTGALSIRAAEWVRRNRAAFCRGYGEVAQDPCRDAALLRAIELDRAVFEARHEHRHRPEWTVIPLSFISEVVTGGPLL